MTKKLGIIQSRGLGDIIISLPIAHHYHKQGWKIYWPICEEFVDHVKDYVPWVNWVPISYDKVGLYFYDVPMERLKNFKCDEILCLYQSLSSHPEFSKELFFQHVKFDEYKYNKAGVPFYKKWQLSECIERNKNKEEMLFNKIVKNTNYVVVHTQGWDHTAKFDSSIIPENWQTVTVTKETNSIFDWLTVLEKAQSIIAVDSSIANLVDQMNIGDDLYFIPRSHIQLTPVLGNSWTWIENENINPNTKIFKSG